MNKIEKTHAVVYIVNEINEASNNERMEFICSGFSGYLTKHKGYSFGGGWGESVMKKEFPELHKLVEDRLVEEMGDNYIWGHAMKLGWMKVIMEVRDYNDLKIFMLNQLKDRL